MRFLFQRFDVNWPCKLQTLIENSFNRLCRVDPCGVFVANSNCRSFAPFTGSSNSAIVVTVVTGCMPLGRVNFSSSNFRSSSLGFVCSLLASQKISVHLLRSRSSPFPLLVRSLVVICPCACLVPKMLVVQVALVLLPLPRQRTLCFPVFTGACGPTAALE